MVIRMVAFKNVAIFFNTLEHLKAALELLCSWKCKRAVHLKAISVISCQHHRSFLIGNMENTYAHICQ